MLADYFARRWFGKPDARMREFTNYVLEAIFGYNGLYFIEKTDLFMKRRAEYGEGVSSSALDGFRITGNAHEDGVIAHAGAIWSLINGEPWPEEVYHDHVKRLVRGGSDLTAYVAARMWPARGLIEHVSYRPLAYRIKKGDFTEEDYKDVIKEILMLSNRFKEYNIIPRHLKFKNDFDISLIKIPEYYIRNFGFSHPVCALISVEDIDAEIVKKIRSSLSGGELPIELISALAFLYLHLNIFIEIGGLLEDSSYDKNLKENVKELFNILKEFFKTNIASHHAEKIINIKSEAVKKFINEFMAIYNISFLEARKLDEILFMKNFERKFFLAFFDLVRKEEKFLENLYFIGDSIFEIMNVFARKYEEIIKRHIMSEYKGEKYKDFLGKYISKEIIYSTEEYKEKSIKNLLDEFSLYEAIFILLNKINEIHRKEKSELVCLLAKEIFGENFGKEAEYKIIEDIIKMIDVREGNVFRSSSDWLNMVKCGISMYSNMITSYKSKYFFLDNKEDGTIYNLHEELLRNMKIIFCGEISRTSLENIIHLINLIYLNNFTDEEEKNKKASELIKILQEKVGMPGDLELKQKYLTFFVRNLHL